MPDLTSITWKALRSRITSLPATDMASNKASQPAIHKAAFKIERCCTLSPRSLKPVAV